MRNHFKGKNIVVVTHGYGVHAINMFEKQIATFNAEYCCANVIKYNGDNAEFLLHNSVAHLRKSKLWNLFIINKSYYLFMTKVCNW